MLRLGLAVVVAALVPAGSSFGVSSTGPGAASEAGRDPAVLVQRVHWPVTIESRRRPPNAAEICANLGPEQIEVLEDGEPQEVTAIGPRPLPRLHALLIDTSRSMDDDLELAKGAAISFVNSLPPEDTALVASFDDDLILGASWTDDKRFLREAVQGLKTGYQTALWDALHDMMLYLEGRAAAEKIVILVTDGEDSSSLPSHTFARILAQAKTLPDLVVFPIGLGLGASTRRESFSASSQLRQLARATGGEFFDIQTVSRLSAVFDGVQQRLAARRYVSYIPRTPARIAPRESGEDDVRRRRVKIDAVAGVPCKVSSLGPGTRAERHGEAPTGGVAVVPSDDAAGALPLFEETCDAQPALSSVTEVLRWEAEPDATGSSRFFVTQDPTRLFGSTHDLLVERGPLYRRQPGIFSRRWTVVPDRTPVFDVRGFVVETPPLAFVRESLTSPGRILLYMLERGHCAPTRSERAPSPRAPIFIHGRTFLELREFLGRTLFRTREDYRAWAEQLTASRIDAQMSKLLEGLPSKVVDEPGAMAGLRSGLLFREIHGPRGRAPFDLVEWLGDVSARTAVADLERIALNRMLSGSETATAELLEREWDKLGRWFAPATSVRVLAPLVPAYDPDLDRLGFYRLTLPRPLFEGRGPRTIPARPRALATLRWLLRTPAIREMLLARSEVRSLRYDVVGRKRFRKLDCVYRTGDAKGKRPPESEWIEVALDLYPGGTGSSDPITLTAYYSRSSAPDCVAIRRPDRAPASWHDTATVLVETLSRETSVR